MSMPVSRLASVDLNLLVYLEALLDERSVTRAGQRLAISQPAVSQALSRLRRHFNDPLLVREGRTYDLTPLARSLRDEVTLTCGLAARVFAAQAVFDPVTTTRQFTLLATDQALAVLGRPLSRALSTAGAGARFQLRQIAVDDVDRLDDVMRGVDGFIAPHTIMGGYPQVELYEDQWVTVTGGDNAAIAPGAALTLDDLADLHWVVAYHNPPVNIALIVRELNARNVDPHVDFVLDSFQSIPFFLAGTDRIACLPQRLARQLAPLGDLTIRPLPFATAPLAEALWWHPTRDRDPGHTWMRSLLGGLMPAGDH